MWKRKNRRFWTFWKAMNNYKIFPLGENALTIDFGNKISVKLNEKVLQFDEFLAQNSFSGFVESVPAYGSLTVFYDVIAVKKTFSAFPTAFEAVKNFIENALPKLSEKDFSASRLVEVPVCFADEFAPDLDFVAECNNLKKQEVIEIFTSQTYRVFMIGFLPGFAYMGEISEKIFAPRRKTPRTKVEKGSVGIAGRQTGIYSLESPGGWQIIGKTSLELFTPEAEIPTLLKAGDSIKFRDVSRTDFQKNF